MRYFLIACFFVIFFLCSSGCDGVTEKDLQKAETELQAFIVRMEEGKTTRKQEQEVIINMNHMLGDYLNYLKMQKKKEKEKTDCKN